MGVSRNKGIPKWMVYFMVPNPIKMDDLGGNTPNFWVNTHIEPQCFENNKNLKHFSAWSKKVLHPHHPSLQNGYSPPLPSEMVISHRKTSRNRCDPHGEVDHEFWKSPKPKTWGNWKSGIIVIRQESSFCCLFSVLCQVSKVLNFRGYVVCKGSIKIIASRLISGNPILPI